MLANLPEIQQEALALLQQDVDAEILSGRISLKTDKIDIKLLTVDQKYSLFDRIHKLNKRFINNHPELNVDYKNIKRIEKLAVRRKLDIDKLLTMAITDNNKMIAEYVERQKQLLGLRQRTYAEGPVEGGIDLQIPDKEDLIEDAEFTEVKKFASPLNCKYEFTTVQENKEMVDEPTWEELFPDYGNQSIN